MKRHLENNHLINAPSYHTAAGNPQLLRIQFTKDYTKFDFGYQITGQNADSLIAKVSQAAFLRLHSTGEKYKLIRADHIPLAPSHHQFNTTKDWLYFNLFFSPLSSIAGKVDLLQSENTQENDLNYFDIIIDPKFAIRII